MAGTVTAVRTTYATEGLLWAAGAPAGGLSAPPGSWLAAPEAWSGPEPAAAKPLVKWAGRIPASSPPPRMKSATFQRAPGSERRAVRRQRRIATLPPLLAR